MTFEDYIKRLQETFRNPKSRRIEKLRATYLVLSWELHWTITDLQTLVPNSPETWLKLLGPKTRFSVNLWEMAAEGKIPYAIVAQLIKLSVREQDTWLCPTEWKDVGAYISRINERILELREQSRASQVL